MGGYSGGGVINNLMQQLPANLQGDQMAGQPATGERRPAPQGNMYQTQGGPNVGSWPGFGMGGLPGRFQGGYGGSMGGMSPYGFGGSPFGYGGYGGGFGYGPGSYSPWGAGSMGYGGGMGMHGGMSPFGSWNPFGGFNPGMWAQQQAMPMMYGMPQMPGGFTPFDPSSIGAVQGTVANPTPAPPPAPIRQPWQDTERSCFVAGTLVRMVDGSDKFIEDVEIGDILLGEDNNENTVLDYDRPLLGDRKVFSFNDGKPFVTAEHPFKTSEGWKSISPEATAVENPALEVDELVPGDLVETIDTVILFDIESIQSHTFDPETPLYNFELSGNQTYYADGFLVHNKGGDNGGGGGAGGGGGGAGGGSGGCFAKGTLFEMADGTFKPIEQIEIGDQMRGGEVYEAKHGKSDRRWFDYLGTDVTDEHFVFELGVWKYVKDAQHAFEIPPKDVYYTLNTTNHRLYGVNGAEFSDDAVFDKNEHVEKAEWDTMLEVLNGSNRASA